MKYKELIQFDPITTIVNDFNWGSRIYLCAIMRAELQTGSMKLSNFEV